MVEELNRTGTGIAAATFYQLALGTLIVALGAYLRISGVYDQPLSLDEATMVAFARGILELGTPVISVGSMDVPLATYELIPYSIALSMSLFGADELGVRLPAVLFGSATTAVIFYTGLRWFNWRVAVLAATLYAISPWATYWGQNCFHPSQTQFFALLLIITVKRLVDEGAQGRGAAYWAVVWFTLAYLSWEGTGFLLPILAGAAVLVSWGKWEWMKTRHIWIAALLVTTVVVAQGVRRIMLQVPYLMVGSGKGDISTPVLAFTRPEYSPYFYIKNFLWLENHVVLTLVIVLGFLLVARSRNLKFIYTVLFLGLFFMTNFLPFYNSHYVYFLLPVYLLAAAGTAVALFDRLGELVAESGLVAVRPAMPVLVVVGLTLILATSGPRGIHLYELETAFKDPKRAELRAGMQGIDYRGVALELANRYRPGDRVIAMAPMPLDYYAGIKGDYFLQTITNRKIIFDPNRDGKYYVDKYVGNRVLRTRAEFEELFSQDGRIWLVAAPYVGYESVVDADTREMIAQKMNVVAEAQDAKLLLWDR